MGYAELGVTVAAFPTALLSETTMTEQQLPLAGPAMLDDEHVLLG